MVNKREKLDKFGALKELFQRDWDANAKRLADSRNWFDFYSGKQWETEGTPDKMHLTFNRCKPCIDAICGSMVSSPRSPRAIARTAETKNSEKTDAMNDLLRWFRNKSGANAAEAQAFRDTLITGLGFISVALSWETSPEGQPVYERLSPLEMIIPASCQKDNLKDARHMWRLTQHTREEMIELFGEEKEGQFGFSTGGESSRGRGGSSNDKSEQIFQLCELRRLEKVSEKYMLPDGSLSDNRPLKGKHAVIPQFAARRYFLGQDSILDESAVLAPAGSLGWHCITAYVNSGTGEFYGVLPAMKDTQYIINRAFSQTVSLWDKSAKGGLIAERDAFDDPKQAQKDWAQGGKIIWVKAGGAKRVQPQPIQEVAQTPKTIFEQADGLFASVSGISLEFLGTREAVQANVLEETRRQSTLNVLASIFGNMGSAREAAAGDIIYLAKNWISEKLLVQGEGRVFKEVNRAAFQGVDFDVYINDAPEGDDEKAYVFSKLQEVVPALVQLQEQNIDPEIVKAIIKYSPLPADITQKAISALDASKEPDPAEAEQEQMGKVMNEQKFKEAEAISRANEAQAKVAAVKAEQELEK